MAKRSKVDFKHAIDLLWSHQIRRENAALHKEVKRLQDEVTSHIDQVKELRAVSEKAKTAAETAIACVQKALADQTTLQTTVEDAHRQAQGANDKISSLEHSLQDGRAKQTETITHFNQEIDKLKADLAGFQERHKLDFDQAETSIQHISTALEHKWEISKLADLEARIDHIEDFLQQGQNIHSLSRVEDSVGDQHGSASDKGTNPLLTLEKSSRASGPHLQDGNEDAELMLTLRDAKDRDDSTEVEEIDLDENVTMMSYAKNMKRDVPVPDSLVMLPEQGTHLTQASTVQPLKQGRFHSWDRYFTEGQALVKKHPRRLEFDIVKSFVEGLYATKQREQCERWLELNGWTWESVVGFGLSGTPSVPIHLNNVNTQAIDQVDANSEKQAKTTSTRNPASASTKQPEKKMVKVPKGKPIVGTRSSQRLRERDQAAKDVHKPQEMEKVQRSSAATSRSQTALNKTATSPRDAKVRFTRWRSSSPVLAANPTQASVQQRIAEGRKPASRQRTKTGDHASAAKHHKARPLKQRASAGTRGPRASTRLKPIQRLPERLSTPPCQQTPSQGPEQAVPRLIKRRRSVDRIHEGRGKKKQRMTNEDGLPPLPALPVRGVGNNEGRKRRGRRLPLPPPPEIPIMPTSDE